MDVSPRDIPTAENIAAISKLEVRDEKGKVVTFGSLFEDQKTVVIFIRTYLQSWTTFPAQWILQAISFVA